MEGLRTDDLGRKGCRILQDPASFCFGEDAVLLASFADPGPSDRVLDLGCGSGILLILLAARERGGSYAGLEILPEAAALARKNAELNGFSGRMEIREGDLKEASALFGRASFDCVITNPPYRKKGSGLVNPGDAKAAARHELFCTLEDVLRESAAVLRPGGRFFLVHRAERLTEVLAGMQAFGLAPDKLRTVHPFEGRKATLVLVSGIRGGRNSLTVLPPLILRGADGNYTREVRDIYGEEAGV